MLTALGWLIGSKLGRQVALTGLAMGALLLVVWRIYSMGAASERAKQAERSLNNLRERIKVDDEISTLPPDARLERLNKWATDGVHH